MIIKTEYYHIYKNKSIYKIDFFKPQYPLIHSLIKSKCITGLSTDEFYKTVTFKAESVKSLNEYLNENKVRTCRSNISILDAIKMTQSLVIQLSNLIIHCHHTILGYNPEYIIMINDTTSVFLGSDFIVEIDENTEYTTICCPFLPTDFFFSPEMLDMKVLPTRIHYKTSYFSLACIILYALLGEKEFYMDFITSKQINVIIEYLKIHHVKDTKLYWLLSRCLIKDPTDRSIIYL